MQYAQLLLVVISLLFLRYKPYPAKGTSDKRMGIATAHANTCADQQILSPYTMMYECIALELHKSWFIRDHYRPAMHP